MIRDQTAPADAPPCRPAWLRQERHGAMPSLPSPIRAIASQPGQWVVPDCCRERVTCARTMNPVDATTVNRH